MNTYRITYTDVFERVGLVYIRAYSPREALNALSQLITNVYGSDEDWILDSIRAI